MHSYSSHHEPDLEELPSAELLHTDHPPRDFPNPWDIPHAPAEQQIMPRSTLSGVDGIATRKSRMRRPFAVKLFFLLGMLMLPVVSGVTTFAALAVDHVFEWELVAETDGASKYIRPQRWQPTSAGELKGYGNMLGKDGASTATVLTLTNAESAPGTYAAMSSNDPIMRSTFLSVMQSADMERAIVKNFSCTSVRDFTMRSDLQQNATTAGIIAFSAKCDRPDGVLQANYRFVVGQDDRIRVIIIGASETNWNENKTVYTKMFTSLEQTRVGQIARDTTGKASNVLGSRSNNMQQLKTLIVATIE